MAASGRKYYVKSYPEGDEAFNRYLGVDPGDSTPVVKNRYQRRRLEGKSAAHRRRQQWFGDTVADDALRASLNGHSGTGRAPRRAGVRRLPDAPHQRYRKGWDARDMSQQIELNIGKVCSLSGVNGTLVGGAIGLALYLPS